MRLKLATILILAALPLAAHHSFAGTYDEGKRVTLEGTVTKILFRNPHSLLSLDVTDAAGRVTTWSMEMEGAGGLFSKGWSKTAVKVGDHVTVLAAPREAYHPERGAVFTVTLANGVVLQSNPHWGMNGSSVI